MKKQTILTKQIKNRYLVYIVLSAYILGSFLGIFIHNVSAIEIKYQTGFEDGTLGNQYNNNFGSLTMSTARQNPYSAYFRVSSTAKSGTKGFEGLYQTAIGPSQGWWNYSYDASKGITNFSFWFKNTNVGTTSVGIYFQGTDGTSIVIGMSTIMVYAQFGGGNVNIRTDLHSNVWYQAGFEILANDSIRYYSNGTSLLGTPAGVSTNDLPHITRTWFEHTGGSSGQGFYYDDINITTSDDLTITTPSTTYIKPDLLCFGDTEMTSRSQNDFNTSGNPLIKMSHFIETFYMLPLNGVMKEFDLLVPNSYVDRYGTMTSDKMPIVVINGQNLSVTPTYYYNYDTTGENTLFVYKGFDFTLDEDIQAETIIEIGFYDSACFCQGHYLEDITNDGATDYYYHNAILNFGNNVLNGQIVPNFDVSFRGWYIANYEQTYPDNIFLSSISLPENNTLQIGYTANVLLGTTYLLVKKIGTSTEYLNITTVPWGTGGDFQPQYYITNDGTGSYYVRLKRGGSYVGNNATFTVTESGTNFILYTNKLSYTSDENIIVYYQYNSTHTGEIKITKNNQIIKYFFINNSDWTLKNNGIGNLPSGLYYIEMGTIQGGQFNPIPGIGQMFSVYSNNIGDSIGLLPESNNGNFGLQTLTIEQDSNVKVLWHNGLLGANTIITINGVLLKDISNNETGTIIINKHDIKTYNISMKRGTNSIVSCYLTIIKKQTGENPLGFTIDPPFSYFAGVFIVILFLLTPLLIGRLTNNMMRLPQFFYLIMAIVGFVIACLFEFFPIWSIFVLIVLAVLIVVIMWLQRKLV